MILFPAFRKQEEPTFIKKLLEEAIAGEQVVLIEMNLARLALTADFKGFRH